MISVPSFVTASMQGRREQAIGSRLARTQPAPKVQSGVNEGLMARVHAEAAKVTFVGYLLSFAMFMRILHYKK